MSARPAAVVARSRLIPVRTYILPMMKGVSVSVTMAVGLSLLLGACTIGMTPDEFLPARRPAGIHTSVRLLDARLEGELLSVNDTSLVILTKTEIMSVPYGSIRSARFRQYYRLGIQYWEQPSSATREELRLLSRFPQGLSGDLLKQLLDVHGQGRIRIVE